MTTIYYAHPMVWYDTAAEQMDTEAIAKQGKLVNPNQKVFSQAVEAAKRIGLGPMQPFIDFIRDEADVVCFRRFYDGKIGAGVAQEVLAAVVWGKKVWEIKGGYDSHSSVKIDKSPFVRNQLDLNAPQFLADTLTVEQTKLRIERRVM